MRRPQWRSWLQTFDCVAPFRCDGRHINARPIVRPYISLSDGSWSSDLEDDEQAGHGKESQPTPDKEAKGKGLSTTTIHLLGIGTVGRFLAYCLGGARRRFPITLLAHRPAFLKTWDEEGQQIKLIKDGMIDLRKGFNVQLLPSTTSPDVVDTDATIESPRNGGFEDEGPISQVIVSTRSTTTLQAMSRIKHRLDNRSTVFLVQQGPGMLDRINEQLFPDPVTRPSYMLGFMTHCIHSLKPGFTVHWTGAGRTTYTVVPRDVGGGAEEPWVSSTRYLIRSMRQSPSIVREGVLPSCYMMLQLEKLAVAAVIEPLTSILNCMNGELLHQPRISRAIRLLLSEISLVIRSLPEMQGIPNIEKRFSPLRLEGIVASLAQETSHSVSPMLRDINEGRTLQIDHINGYIVRRGEELGIKCFMNYLVMQMVLGRSLNVKRQMEGYVPFGASWLTQF